MQRLWHEDRILGALAAGATVVTASERLARGVRLAHADAANARGVQVWERPAVLSWTAFLHDQYKRLEDIDLRPGPRLLASHQAEALWEAVIRADQGNLALLQPAATAKAVASAWEMCRAYSITLTELSIENSSDDSRQYAIWARAYSTRCESDNLLDPARLPDYLTEKITDSGITVPKQCLFAGFEEFTPQQQRLLDTLGSTGSQVQLLPVSGQRSSRQRRIESDDALAEIEAAARWARARLEVSPTPRIAVVVRDLGEQRHVIARVFDRILCPGVPPSGSIGRPYNLSTGKALTDIPVVSDALLMLGCLRWRLPFAQACRLLRSPFLSAADSESGARARLEINLRDLNLDQVGLSRLLAMTQKSGKSNAFRSMLEAVLQLQRNTPVRQLPSEWSQTFGALLKACGWPGERTPDTHEYQAVQAMRESLSEFAQLDAVLPTIDAEDALTRLSRMITRREFQPASADVPLQILGIPETAGLQFDYLWIMGLTEDVWPASPRPDPFIPWTIQQRHHLPHASAARELQYASQTTQRLLECALEVVVSTPARNTDTELRPSPLLVDIGEIAQESLLLSTVQDWRQQLQQAAVAALSEFTDTRAPPLADTAPIAGGTQVLKAQAACPFRSFSIYRLGARELATPTPGLNAMERGSLLHDILARLWAKLKDHASLSGLQPDGRRKLIEVCVAQGINKSASRNPDAFTPNFRQLEQERLTRLIAVWLEIEAARTPFSVEPPEQKHSITLGRLRLDTRVDRIDRLPDGGRVVIDYKSGAAEPRDWLGERPDEPQLPIYAVSEPQPLTAVLFAQLQTGDLGYRGFAEQGGLVSEVGAYGSMRKQPEDPQDWAALLAHWRAVVTALAEEFVQGEARVDPKYKADTCRYCHLQALCRIHESDGLSLEEADAQA